MTEKIQPIYVPALRLKQGEYRALQKLSDDISSQIRPRFIVPPAKEFDPEKKKFLSNDEIAYLTGRRIAEHWPLRSAYLETQYLNKHFGEGEINVWLPRIFELAREAGAKLIPVATLNDLTGARVGAFEKIIDPSAALKLAIRITSDEIDHDIGKLLSSAMIAVGVSSKQISLIADFCDADFSNLHVSSEVLQGAFEDLQEAGQWDQIIFQGTSFPIKNPAKAGTETAPVTMERVSRDAWLAWNMAIDRDSNFSERFIYGDYGADNAKMDFKFGGGGIAIRHYRYATSNEWLVARGTDTGKHSKVMPQVAKKILESGDFSGRGFSVADSIIYNLGSGLGGGSGSASQWREINMIHHITQVVRDIGVKRGLKFRDVHFADESAQIDLFEPVE